MESRSFEYTYQSFCGQDPPVRSSGTVERHYFYYCQDSENYELFQPSPSTFPLIPACRLKSGKVDPDKQPRQQNCCNVGNPINVATGSKYQRTVDYVGPGVFPLQFERYYFGGSWSTSYSRRILLEDINGLIYHFVRVKRDDGQELTFQYSNGTYTSEVDVNSRLERRNVSGQFAGWRYTDTDDSVELYDTAGRLESVTSRSGLRHVISRDASGRLQSVTDSFGRQLTLSYDASGNIASMTDPAGGTYTYVSGSLVAGVTYPDLTTTTYLYNESAYTSGANLPGALTGILDQNNTRFATFKYDAGGRAIQTEHAGGAERISVAYNTNGSVAITDAFGVARTLTMQVKLAVVKPTAFTGSPCSTCATAASYTYDPNGNVSSRYDWNGTVTSFAYSADGRDLVTARYDAGNTSDYFSTGTAWHSAYRIPTQITEGSRRTNFTHDAAGNILTRTVTDTATSQTRVWTYTYDSYGHVLTEDGPRTDVSDVTTWSYYACNSGYECGQVHTATDALGQVTTFHTYNAHGQPLTLTDANGTLITLTYDSMLRVTSRTVGSEATTLEYWPTGLLKKVTLPDGSFTLNTYDDAHRLIQVEDQTGNRIEYTLDAMGNRTAENAYDASSALAGTRSRVVNSLNQIWKEVGADGTAGVTTTFGYDNNGNVTSVNAPLSRNSGNQYDGRDRLKQITDASGGLTKFTYNRFDDPLTIIDPRNKTTTYTYNNFGDLKQLASPDTGTTVYTFDSGGNLETTTDARSKTGTYSYDALSRLMQIAYPDRTVSFTYDAGTNGNGRLTGASDANHALSWSYDPQGRVLNKSQTVGGVGQSVGYGYTNGNLTSLTTPSGQVIGYTYTDGRVTGITVNGSTILHDVLYEPFGPVRQWTWGNATFANRTYDLDGNPAAVDIEGATNYSIDDAFRITGIADLNDSSRSWTFGYDSLDRLTSASRTGQAIGFTYDASGNRLTQTGTTAATYTISSTNNRITSITGTPARTYAYDAAGNATGFAGLIFSYDDSGRMSSVASGGLTTSYILNALGQRVRKASTSATRLFAYDESGRLLGEYDGTGALIQETVWLGDIPVATLRPNGSGVSVYYVHTDHLNTPRRLSRPANNVVVWRWHSDPFGTTAPDEDPDGDSTPIAYNLRFPGQYFDAESGLHYNYFRDYDPAVGRYVESDPIGLRGGVNTYAYVDGNPLSYSDSTGLAPPGRAVPSPLPPGPFAFPLNPSPWSHDAALALEQAIENAVNAVREMCGDDTSKAMHARLPLDVGGAEWGRRNGVGADEGRRRAHKIKQQDKGRPTDKYTVDPDTGNVYDPNGDFVGNARDVRS